MFRHYIIVRRDLPVGITAANIAHAAGESFFAFGTRPRSSEVERLLSKQKVESSEDSGGSTFLAGHTIAVVLRARAEADLKKLALRLNEHGIDNEVIVEVDGTYSGQVMAIGVWPTDRNIREMFNGYQLYGAD
jgi:peptidyl-tRNA hydrolase